MGAARPEAAFYRWRSLTQEQRRVATEIQSWLLSFSSLPIPARSLGTNIFDWQRIDETRASNVIVIDGPRGAGKTSLMLTLVELWRRSLAEEKLDEVFERKLTSAGETDLEALSLEQSGTDNGGDSIAAARVAVSDLQHRIIPIRVLDFGPLPSATSLVTWVAAQLREFIDLLDDRMTPAFSDVSTRPVVPWEPDWDKELPSRKAWAELIASAAWGWDDNIQARKGALDPDAYAEELQQSERARVGIVDRWRRVIGAIVKDAAQRHRGRISETARIVIPIDDVDVNPMRTADLLEFVRTFWDPQLVFLLSGDSDLILAALTEHHGKLGVTRDRVSQSAAQSYDKVVPLAQRFRIGPVKPAERVELLREQLGNLSGLVSSTSLGLKELLQKDRWAAEALPATLRAIHDARQKLTGRTKVSEVVTELWSDALTREVPDPTKRKEISERVDLGRDGMPSVEAEIDAHAERLGEFRLSSSDSSDEPRRVRTYLVLEAVSAFVPFDMDGSSRLHGALLLAADIAADDPDSAWSEISIAGNGYKFPAVRARIVASITSEDRTAAERAEALLKRGVRWPVPDWPAPVDLGRFAEEWRSVLPTILLRRGDENRGRDLVLLFLKGVRSAYLERAAQREAVTMPSTVKDAMSLILTEGEETATISRHQRYVEWARGRALLLAAPESGLDVSTAAQILSALPTDTSKRKARGARYPPKGVIANVQTARSKRARITYETLAKKTKGPAQEGAKGTVLCSEEVDAMLAAIDAAFRTHPWVMRFGIWPGKPASAKA